MQTLNFTANATNNTATTTREDVMDTLFNNASFAMQLHSKYNGFPDFTFSPILPANVVVTNNATLVVDAITVTTNNAIIHYAGNIDVTVNFDKLQINKFDWFKDGDLADVTFTIL